MNHIEDGDKELPRQFLRLVAKLSRNTVVIDEIDNLAIDSLLVGFVDGWHIQFIVDCFHSRYADRIITSVAFLSENKIIFNN